MFIYVCVAFASRNSQLQRYFLHMCYVLQMYKGTIQYWSSVTSRFKMRIHPNYIHTHSSRSCCCCCGTTLCPNMKTPFTYTYCTVRTSSQTTKWRRSLLVDETRLDSLLILTWCVTNLIPQRTNTDRILFFSLSSRRLNKRFHCWEEKGKLLTTYIITLASYSYCTHLRDYLHLY